MVYHDIETNGASHPNIYFAQSTDSGTTWSERIQVNIGDGVNQTDQWQPTMTVKPDGTQLFIAWHDRREDTNDNHLIRTYGVFARLPVTNSGSFATNFPISSTQFSAAFTGTNDIPGTYDRPITRKSWQMTADVVALTADSGLTTWGITTPRFQTTATSITLGATTG